MLDSQQLTAAQEEMAVHCWGAGELTVVLLHGLPGSGRSWAAVAKLLAAQRRVLVPDLVGFGASARSVDPRLLHAEGQAAVLEQALGRLGVRRAVLVGHDFGGPVALTVARRHPDLVAGLGLLAANAFGDTPIPFPLSAVTWPVLGRAAARTLFCGPSLRSMIRRGGGSPRPTIDVAAAVGDRTQRRAIRVIFETSLTGLVDLYRPIEDGLGRIAVPTVVGWGDHDPFFSVEQGRRTAAAIPGARFRLYRGAGHFLPEERPAEVAADLAALLSAVGGRR